MREIRVLVAMAWRVDRRLTLAMIAEPFGNTLVLLSGLWLAMLTNGVIQNDIRQVVIGVAALVLGAGLGWQLDLSASQWRMVLGEKVAHAFDTEIARLSAELPTLDHFERAEYQDQLEILRQRQGQLGNSMSALAVTIKAICAGLTVLVLLVVAHPAMLALVLLALPALLITKAQRRWRAQAEDESALPGRTARHLRAVAQDRDAAVEIRLFGLADNLERRIGTLWNAQRRPIEHAERKVALLSLAQQVLYVIGVIAAVGFVLHQAIQGRSAPGDVVLAIYLGQQVQTAVIWPIQAVAGFGRTLHTVSRFLWLADHAHTATGNERAPEQIVEGIRLENVSFHYPGTDKWVLRNVSLTIPAGAALAVVGANGAGKTTLVKLLTRMYEPTEGRITVDGVDLADLDVHDWRARLAAAFQDFARFEFTVQHAVGVGDLDHLDDTEHVRDAITRAGADVLDQDAQLGTSWGGTDLSTGQWQRIALARGLARTTPLVRFFDEPTASLDAFTEDALFDSMTRATDGANGMITILVTHRFSTVRSADLIVVLADGGVAERGSHRALLAENGRYARLYRSQADAFAD
ncbi:ATP-binding cassette, subfamily B [Lentzea waywayandensis]|uniref:ATP-binding cassette, subfamily B n=1 Tax=Lentzea waywayandensis TaxID=84724 RepID=A0A1I6DGX1_9PSEU|nr:ABC transporter ATP-binding protein [Lentzea waywayandensis]SFR04572.1 ATP-binding cassette, subfamily B [Lentzea waywayandensis]